MVHKNNQNGITLVVLVITIIIILILAGVTIMLGLGQNGILNKATTATQKFAEAAESERNMDVELSPEIEALLPDGNKIKFKNIESLQQYVGKAIKDFKLATSLPVGTKLTTLSATYKLYYIDTENKYGDGVGTIYLKADEFEETASQQLSVQTTGNIATSKIYQLNPSITAEKLKAKYPDLSDEQINAMLPKETNKGMKKAIWLTDTEVWNSLLIGLDPSIKNSINYVVGAPSVELFMDSYNSYYNLTGDEPEIATRTSSSERTKLFYEFPYCNNKNGYFIGPGNSSDSNNALKLNNENFPLNLGAYTNNYILLPDETAGNLYYPNTDDVSYYLASPSCKGNDKILRVLVDAKNKKGCFISYDNITAGFCPIISLKTGSNLTFEE